MREWITGRNPVFEVLKTKRRSLYRMWLAKGIREDGRIREILSLSASAKLPLEYVPRERLNAMASGHQGVAIETGGFSYCDLLDILDVSLERDEPPLILILDTLQDPHNLGSLLRTAEIIGVHGVLLPKRRTATVTPAVVSVSSGASEHLSIAQINLVQAIKTLKKAGVWVVGLAGDPEALPPDQVRLDGAIALVVGNEGTGLRPLVRSSCDLVMRLPMRGKIDSLNAAVAGSVALYLTWQARQYAGYLF